MANQHLQNYLELHQSVSKERELIEKATRRKTLVLQAYSKHKNINPQNGSNAELSKKDEVLKGNVFSHFPPTYYLYSLVSMFFFFPLGLYAVIQAKKVSFP